MSGIFPIFVENGIMGRILDFGKFVDINKSRMRVLKTEKSDD